jgi:hypothetical protein
MCIFVKYYVADVHENLWRNSKFGYNRKTNGERYIKTPVRHVIAGDVRKVVIKAPSSGEIVSAF